MVQWEITSIFISSEQIERFLINHQFLEQKVQSMSSLTMWTELINSSKCAQSTNQVQFKYDELTTHHKLSWVIYIIQVMTKGGFSTETY